MENWNIHVEGIGNYGSTYLANWVDNWWFNVGAGDLPYTGTWTVTQTIIGKGDAANLLYRYTAHTTINNNGEVTSDFETEDASCK